MWGIQYYNKVEEERGRDGRVEAGRAESRPVMVCLCLLRPLHPDHCVQAQPVLTKSPWGQGRTINSSVAFKWRFSKIQTYAVASWVLQKITENSGTSE